MGFSLKSLNPVRAVQSVASAVNNVVVKPVVSAVQDAWVPVRNAAEDAASVALAVATKGASVPFTTAMVADGAATSDNKLLKKDKNAEEAQRRAVETAKLQGQAYADAVRGAGLNYSPPVAGDLLGAYQSGGASSGGAPDAVVQGGGASPGVSPVFLLLLAAGAFYVFKKR